MILDVAAMNAPTNGLEIPRGMQDEEVCRVRGLLLGMSNDLSLRESDLGRLADRVQEAHEVLTTHGVPVRLTALRPQDVEDIWQSVVDAMPDADESTRRAAFAQALQSARATEL
jgi:hypothetical protein